MSEIYEVTAIEKKTKRTHKVYIRAANAERADRFGQQLHRMFGVRGRFETRVNIWNPLTDLSISRYITRVNDGLTK